MRPVISPLRIALLLTLAGSAYAVDGVLEINQACAENTGCFSGDSAGFPVTLSASGSYRLTSDLDRSAASLSTHAVSITDEDVTLDLNGFSIRGAAVCSGTPVSSCTNTGSGHGVASFGFDNVVVENGSVRGQPADGIRISGTYARVDGVAAISNGGDGVSLSGGTVRGSVASENGQAGITGFALSVVQNHVHGNGDEGINATTGSLVIDNRVTSNGAFALEVSNTRLGYGRNTFQCNNSGGSCTNVAQVSDASAIEIGINLCGSDAVCP